MGIHGVVVFNGSRDDNSDSGDSEDKEDHGFVNRKMAGEASYEDCLRYQNSLNVSFLIF